MRIKVADVKQNDLTFDVAALQDALPGVSRSMPQLRRIALEMQFTGATRRTLFLGGLFPRRPIQIELDGVGLHLTVIDVKVAEAGAS